MSGRPWAPSRLPSEITLPRRTAVRPVGLPRPTPSFRGAGLSCARRLEAVSPSSRPLVKGAESLPGGDTADVTCRARSRSASPPFLQTRGRHGPDGAGWGGPGLTPPPVSSPKTHEPRRDRDREGPFYTITGQYL